MIKPFNPAPLDKHADDPREAARADKAKQNKLDEGLEGSFPASDPASETQPKKGK